MSITIKHRFGGACRLLFCDIDQLLRDIDQIGGVIYQPASDIDQPVPNINQLSGYINQLQLQPSLSGSGVIEKGRFALKSAVCGVLLLFFC
ncbi:hypothetical protein [Mesobacillus zeae]|uniref:hypothetical protein n=1 Tax=Mesobacillus zeae TaxID=1917180 RepID=UPI0015E6F646|nr:hypothetical protein [Mesobacillus zeae]